MAYSSWVVPIYLQLDHLFRIVAFLCERIFTVMCTWKYDIIKPLSHLETEIYYEIFSILRHRA